LIAVALAWPLLLGGAAWQRAHRHPEPIWTSAVYVVSAIICHRKPERSFHTADVQWPVCGRCSGLYLGAGLGALIAVVLRRRGGNANHTRLIVLTAIPTVLTVALEWLHLYDVGNLGRAVAGIPTGAAVVLVIASVVDRLASDGPDGHRAQTQPQRS
jgi:uncharacterized membrane protein